MSGMRSLAVAIAFACGMSHSVVAQQGCDDTVFRSCKSPQQAEARRAAIRQDFANGVSPTNTIRDPDFKRYCAVPLSTYRPQKGFQGLGLVLHEYSPFNGVRVLFAAWQRRLSTGRLYFKTLLALLEADNVHYQFLIVNCFLPTSMTSFSRIQIPPPPPSRLTPKQQEIAAQNDAHYEKAVGGDVAIDVAGEMGWNHELIEVIQELFMADRQPDVDLWYPSEPMKPDY